MVSKKFVSKILLIITLNIIVLNSFASSNLKQYDIFLIPSEKATNYIANFNKSLAETNILKKYSIVPFIKNHPVHLTLYLTSFQSKYISNINSELKTLAESTKPLHIETKGITVGKSGFVMLDIKKSKKLQNLSNNVIKNLAQYRNKNYSAPDWVKFYPKKLKYFKKYGSPNAFSEFNPHLSILAADLKNDKIRNCFVKDFNEVIDGINIKPTDFKINAIGLGEVDNNGQVVKTLHIYKLKS